MWRSSSMAELDLKADLQQSHEYYREREKSECPESAFVECSIWNQCCDFAVDSGDASPRPSAAVAPVWAGLCCFQVRAWAVTRPWAVQLMWTSHWWPGRQPRMTPRPGWAQVRILWRRTGSSSALRRSPPTSQVLWAPHCVWAHTRAPSRSLCASLGLCDKWHQMSTIYHAHSEWFCTPRAEGLWIIS